MVRNAGRELTTDGVPFPEWNDGQGVTAAVDTRRDSPVKEDSMVNEDDAQSHIDAGTAHEDSDEYGKAIAEFSEAIRLTTDRAYECYVRRAHAYARVGDFDRAAADYNMAIGLDPDFDVAYCMRGEMYANRGDYDMAIVDYDIAVRLATDETYGAYAHLRRSEVHAMRNEYDRAIADFENAIRLGGSAAHALVSERDIRGYLESQFSAAYAHALKGDAYLAIGDRDRAIADYGEEINLGAEEDLRDYYISRGDAHAVGDDWVQAMEDYDGAVRADAASPSTYLRRGIGYIHLGEGHRAIEDLYRVKEFLDEIEDSDSPGT